jgi:hypothetical protein
METAERLATPDRIQTHHTYATGPRWAAPRKALVDIANYADCQIVFTGESGWLNKTWFFDLTGTDANVLRFVEVLEQSIKEYNKR